MSDTGLVHVIDDDEAVRGGLGSLIRSVGNDVCLYSSTTEFLSKKLPSFPSCLLLDVRLPGINGLDFQASLHRYDIRIPVILITGYGDIQMSVRAMKAGAVDFLTKPLRHQDVLDAVAAALSRDRLRQVDEAKISIFWQRFETLTSRELQVLALVTAGKMNKQVAGDLQLSEITVKIYRSSVMKKMQARSLADLVKMAEALRAQGHIADSDS